MKIKNPWPTGSLTQSDPQTCPWEQGQSNLRSIWSEGNNVSSPQMSLQWSFWKYDMHSAAHKEIQYITQIIQLKFPPKYFVSVIWCCFTKERWIFFGSPNSNPRKPSLQNKAGNQSVQQLHTSRWTATFHTKCTLENYPCFMSFQNHPPKYTPSCFVKCNIAVKNKKNPLPTGSVVKNPLPTGSVVKNPPPTGSVS